MFRLDDRVAVVTGASSGIGARLARALRDAGAQVVVAARRAERLDLPGATAVACDVSDDADCARLVGLALDTHGRIDVLVNNAGTTWSGRAEDEPPAEFRRVLDVNLTAAFVLSQLVGRHMLERGSGSIVNIASMFGLVGTTDSPQAGYTASKGGLIALTKELAAQWAGRGVRVNAIAPGFFPSEMTERLFGDERAVAWMQRNVPMGRGGEEHELDGALLFLAGDASTYVTGTVVAVDGGWTAV